MLVKNLNHSTCPFYTGRVAAMYDTKDQTDAISNLQMIPYPGHVIDEDKSTPLKFVNNYNLTKVFRLHLTYFHNGHIY